MGAAGGLCAEKFKISREDQDQFAIESYQRAQNAARQGLFKKEIVPVQLPRKGDKDVVVEEDEEVMKFDGAKMKTLKPVFRQGDRKSTRLYPSHSQISYA